MVKAIQIRNVPVAVHRRLVARAADAGMSLSEFLLSELQELAALPTDDEMRERLRARKPAGAARTATSAIRKARDSA
jgi:hypothetical protein